MELKFKAAMISTLLLLNGCATVGKSVVLGAAVGGLAGGVIGQSQNPQGGGAVGMAVGAGIGSLISYLAFKEKAAKSSNDQPKPLENDFPFLTKPKLRSIWVPDKIEGNQYIKGHYIYIIEDPGTWSKD
jgi:hypothetical protein